MHIPPRLYYFTASLEYSQIATIWSGVVEAARERQINLFCFAGGNLGSPHNSRDYGNVIYQLLDEHSLDGVIIEGTIGTYEGEDDFRTLCQHHPTLPVVSVIEEGAACPSVITNNETGVRELISHLVEGHGLSPDRVYPGARA